MLLSSLTTDKAVNFCRRRTGGVLRKHLLGPDPGTDPGFRTEGCTQELSFTLAMASIGIGVKVNEILGW